MGSYDVYPDFHAYVVDYISGVLSTANPRQVEGIAERVGAPHHPSNYRNNESSGSGTNALVRLKF